MVSALYFLIILLFLGHVNASSIGGKAIISSVYSRQPRIVPQRIRICADHINSFKVSQTKEGKHFLFGLHHDYQFNFAKNGLLHYSNIVWGPKGSFGANVFINGVDYGFKTLFPPRWTYEKIAFFIAMVCINHYKTAGLDPCGKKDIFNGIMKGIPVRIVFDQKRSLVMSAYPLIEKPANKETLGFKN